MNLNDKCLNMEPSILLGIANDKLRHECTSLNSLAAEMGVKPELIEQRMAEIHFHYEDSLNQFTPDLKHPF